MGKKYQENGLFDIFYVIVDEGEDHGCQSPFDSNLERIGNKMGILDEKHRTKKILKNCFQQFIDSTIDITCKC